jgi:hypothetical protein
MRFEATRLGVEVLPDRINPDGSVAVFDNNDGRQPPNASTPEFENAANDFQHNYGSHSWSNIIGILELHVAAYGTIDTLYIFDHGAAGQQSFGDQLLTVDQLAQLNNLVTPGGTIVFGGCGVGAGQVGQDYIDAVADATCTQVVAADTPVHYWTDDEDGLDFFVPVGGQWIGSHDTDVSPTLGLVREVSADMRELGDTLIGDLAGALQPVWVGPSVAPPVWSGDGSTSGVVTHRTFVTVNLW